MYTLLIAEDEDIIRQGLISTFDWKAYGFKLVAAAENGMDALEKYDIYKPDVVLTDIKMPIMDGIELLKAIRSRSTETEVVLISGFQEFEYARKGIELSSFAYILKENLYDEIPRVFSQLSIRLKHNAKNKKHLHNLMSLQNYLQLGKVEDWQSFGLIGSFFCVFVLWLPNPIEDRFLDLAADEQSLLCVKDSYLICTYSTNTVQEMKKLINKKCIDIVQYAQSLEYSTYVFGIGLIKDKSDQITQCYREAMKAVDWGRLYSISVCRYDSIINKLSPQKKQPDLSNLETYIMLNQKVQLIQLINSLCYDYIHMEGSFIPDLQVLCNDIINRFFHHIRSFNLNTEHIKNLLSSAYMIDSYIDYNNWIVNEISKLCDTLEHARHISSMQGIERVVHLIDRYFQMDLSLENAAKYAYMTPSNFSVKFKEFTGMTFSDYVRKKRIDYACHLLSTTDLKVYAVAQQSGYEDEKYFCRVFKLVTGMSPGTYKQRMAK